MSDLQKIKEQVSIYDVAESLLRLEKQDGKYKYPGERTASIKLYPENNRFHDFGRNVNGDIFDLMVMKVQADHAPFVSIAPWSFIKDECIVKYYPEGHYQKPEQITTTLHDALMIAQYYYECGVYVQFTMSLCIEWLFLYVRDDPRYSPPQQKSWYTKNVEEYPEIKTMLESEQRFEIIGALRRLPQNFLFKGLPDDIKDDYKLMDF